MRRLLPISPEKNSKFSVHFSGNNQTLKIKGYSSFKLLNYKILEIYINIHGPNGLKFGHPLIFQV